MFKNYLREQIKLHPSIQPQDVVKLCFQATFGAEHLLGDMERVRKYFDDEYLRLSARDGLLVEHISENVCRVNLAVWKKRGLCAERLFGLFVQSAQTKLGGGEELFWEYIAQADGMPFPETEWQSYIEEYKKGGVRPVHHSEVYRSEEHPAYRVIAGENIKKLEET